MPSRFRIFVAALEMFAVWILLYYAFLLILQPVTSAIERRHCGFRARSGRPGWQEGVGDVTVMTVMCGQRASYERSCAGSFVGPLWAGGRAGGRATEWVGARGCLPRREDANFVLSVTPWILS